MLVYYIPITKDLGVLLAKISIGKPITKKPVYNRKQGASPIANRGLLPALLRLGSRSLVF
jgi:hypothetical protein